jgi:hypothetical protein
MVNLPPETCNIAFKEWSGVCEALIEGRQTVILRKGGISESAGPGQFAPEHTEFWLYPTWAHQSQTALRPLGESATKSEAAGPGPGGVISIRGLVRVGFCGYVSDVQTLESLRQFHCLDDETLLKRFTYRKTGLWVLAARVWRRDSPLDLVASPEYAGCTTWVILDQSLPTSGLTPVIDDPQWAVECHRIRAILSKRAPGDD